MPDRTNLACHYDGTFDGFLTVVFEAYAQKLPVNVITASGQIQTGFGQSIRYIETQEEKARRVERGILGKFGGAAMQQIATVFWSGDEDKDTVLYRYIRAGFEQGRHIYNNLTHPDVLAANNLYRNISREEQRVKGFVRFSLMENGVYYASIAPRNNLVPLLTPHFADRFSDMPFLIHDTAHHLAGVYNGNGWYLVESEELTPPDITEQEHEMRRMWRLFYDAIAVQGRISAKRRRGMMPKFYWGNMPEMSPRYAGSILIL